MTLMQRRRALMAVSKGETWDFEWDSTSGTVPLGMVYNDTPTFTSGLMVVQGPFSMLFDYVGLNCEIEIAMYSNAKVANNPQIALRKQSSTGAKIIFDSSTKRGYMAYNVRTGNTSTDIKTTEMHTYNIKCINGVYTISVDGSVIASDTGVVNNPYMTFTGIDSTGGETSSYHTIKSIKFRRQA